MFLSREFTLGMFQRSVQNFCPKIIGNEGKSVRKLLGSRSGKFYLFVFCKGMQLSYVLRVTQAVCSFTYMT